MKNNSIIILALLAVLSCSKTDEIKNYAFEATIVGQGDNTDYYVLNITNISGDPRILDGVYFASEINNKFKGDNPFTGDGYEGTRIKLNCSLIEDQTFKCEFMGQAIPFVQVSSAIVDDNQEENIDQRMINNDTKCLPFRKVYGTNQFDINQDDTIDFDFMFWNRKATKNDSVWTYSDLSINSFSNLIFFTETNSVQAMVGDTIKFNGIVTENWSKYGAGTYLLRYFHSSSNWDESYWKLGETGYLKLLIKINNQYHTAWMQIRVDLDSFCKCSVTIVDSYYNPMPNQNSIVGYKN